MEPNPADLRSPFNLSYQTCEWGGDWSRVLSPRCGLWELLLTGVEDEYSSLVVFLSHAFLIRHLDMVLNILIAVGGPCFFFYYSPDGEGWAFGQSWTLVSILLVFPLTMTLSSGFNRRETALMHLATVKANLLSILLAHQDWDWYSFPKDSKGLGETGRHRLPSEHLMRVQSEILALCSTLKSTLMAPTVTRARHFYTNAGKRERRVVMEHHEILRERTAYHMHNLSLLAEELKASGLPANEATRIRQYATAVLISLLQLRLIKQYRTPLGLRAFSRVMIMLMPFMFGPYYAEMAKSTGIIFTVCFSVTCSLGLLGLFNLRYELEDPFLSLTGGLDVIDISQELGEVEKDMRIFLSRSYPVHTHPAPAADATSVAVTERKPDQTADYVK